MMCIYPFLEICRLPVDKGPCEGGYHRRWYFDNERGECIPFIYTGCGGNFNRFRSFQSCLDTCKVLLAATEPRKSMGFAFEFAAKGASVLFVVLS